MVADLMLDKEIIQEFYSVKRRVVVLEISKKINRAAILTRDDETVVEQRIVELATQYGRYSYRTIMDMMRNEGILINRIRVYRIWGKSRFESAKEASETRAIVSE